MGLFKQAIYDTSLFTRGTRNQFIALLYMLMASPDETQIQQIKDHLHSSFKIKDLGPLKFFLGTEVSISFKGIEFASIKRNIVWCYLTVQFFAV